VLTLDTPGPRDEEDANVRSATPESSKAVTGPAAIPVLRELFVDVSCADLVRTTLGSSSVKVVTVDLALLLASGTATTLSTATAIALGPTLRRGLTAIEAIEQLRALVPQIGIYVVARSTAEVAWSLPRLAAVGVDEVFCLDAPSDGDAFNETMSHRLAAPAPETEIRLLWKWFRESPERSLVMHCVRNGYRLDVWSVRSRVFSACRKTLQNRMTLVGLPSPGLLSRCGRVLHAQELERRGVKPTTLVADILGFPSAGAMQRSRRRLRKALMSRGRQALVFASLLKYAPTGWRKGDRRAAFHPRTIAAQTLM
jgi:hypothetical protein